MFVPAFCTPAFFSSCVILLQPYLLINLQGYCFKKNTGKKRLFLWFAGQFGRVKSKVMLKRSTLKRDDSETLRYKYNQSVTNKRNIESLPSCRVLEVTSQTLTVTDKIWSCEQLVSPSQWCHSATDNVLLHCQSQPLSFTLSTNNVFSALRRWSHFTKLTYQGA